MNDKQSTTVITGEVIISYPHLVTPQKDEKTGMDKWSAALIFLEGSPDLPKLEGAVIAAAREKFGSEITLPNGQKIPVEHAFTAGVLRHPIRKDSVAKGYPAGSVFTNVRTNRKPVVVWPYKDPVTGKPKVMTDDEVTRHVYPGAIVRASINAYGYNRNGNKGVSFALNNIQRIRDGERLDNRVPAEDEFDALSEAPADLAGLI